MIIMRDLKKILKDQGFEEEGGTIGNSFLQKHIDDKHYICISDIDSTIDVDYTDELLVSLSKYETGEPVGTELNSEFELKQRVFSDITKALDYVESLETFVKNLL